MAEGGKGRRVAFSVVSAVFAAASLGGLFGIGIVIGWFDTDQGGIHRVHDIGFGVLSGIIITTAFVALIWQSERRPSVFLQLLAAGVAGLAAGAISADGGYAFLPAMVLVAAAILFAIHPQRAALVRATIRPSPVLAVVAVIGAVPLIWYALTAARLQRTGIPADPHVSMSHWANMAAMALALVLVGLLAALRPRGWRLTAWCAGLGVAAFGLASMVFHRFPGTDVPYPGSEGTGWGLVAAVGGLLFVAAAEWQARRDLAMG